MTTRPITEADHIPGLVQPVFGISQSGLPVGEMRYWAFNGSLPPVWLSTCKSGISMPMIVTHVVEGRR